MKWFRSNVKHASRLALLAMALQLVMTFGHFHGVAAEAAPAIQARLAEQATPAMTFPARVAVLPPAARLAAALLRIMARAGLLGICVALLFNEPLRTNTLAQIRMFSGLFLAPEAAAWCVLFAFAAQTCWAAQPMALFVLPIPFATVLIVLVVLKDRYASQMT